MKNAFCVSVRNNSIGTTTTTQRRHQLTHTMAAIKAAAAAAAMWWLVSHDPHTHTVPICTTRIYSYTTPDYLHTSPSFLHFRKISQSEVTTTTTPSVFIFCLISTRFDDSIRRRCQRLISSSSFFPCFVYFSLLLGLENECYCLDGCNKRWSSQWQH